MLTNKALEGYKEYTERTVAYVKYKIGNTYYTANIHRKERLSDGRIAMYCQITPQASSDVTISEVQLYDTNNDLFLSKSENLVIRQAQEGVLYRFTFDFKEV